MPMAIGGFAQDETGHTVGRTAAHARWVPAARDLLAGVAARPMGTIGHADFAARIQADTGVSALVPASKWLGNCLTAVAEAARADGIPCLTALVVTTDGKVGEVYDGALAAYDRPEPASSRERENLAATERIACYQWAGAPEPAGGWRAKASVIRSSSRTAAPRARAAATRTEERPMSFCPSCFMALPATGRCDFCA